MERVKPCSTDSKNLNYKAFENDFQEVSKVLEESESENYFIVSEPQAQLMLFELGFINEKSNEDVEMAADLIN